KLGPQSFARHQNEIVGRRSGGELEKMGAGTGVMEDFILAVDEHGRWSKEIQQQTLGHLGEGDHWSSGKLRRTTPLSPSLGRGDDGKSAAFGPGRTNPPVNPPLFRLGLEQIDVPADGFRGAQKQSPSLLESEVEQGNHFLLYVRFEVDEQIAAAN